MGDTIFRPISRKGASNLDSDLDRTRNSYDKYATQIADGFWGTELNQSWDAFSHTLPQGAKVADIGCGPGRDTAQFRQRGYWTTGLDYSSGMLQEAMQRAPAPYLQGDMRFLPFAADSFEGAWVCASLLHIPREDAPAVLAGIWRILKPGGSMFLALKEGQGEGWDTRKGDRFFTFYQQDEIRLLLQSAGFVITELQVHQAETVTWLNLYARKPGPQLLNQQKISSSPPEAD